MDILNLQQKLLALGFDPGPVDGIMGPKTEAAIIDFQTDKGLIVDGVVGLQTVAALDGGLAAPSASTSSEEGRLQILDVSGYQGIIDFAKVKASGYPAVAIKATEGLHFVDPQFRASWKNAKDANVTRFAYHFLHPNLDGGAQADLFLRTLGGDLGEIVAALDWEIDGGVSASQQTAQADAWYNKVDLAFESAGFQTRSFAYSFSSFFAGLKLPERYAERPLWLAGYVRESRLVIPSPWMTYSIWQYAGDDLSPPVNGIDPKLKKDYNKYHGTLASFLAAYGK